jgi:molybdate/tungstate transport system substrate-binding protein
MTGRTRLVALALLAATLTTCKRPKELVVFYAASLRHLISDAAKGFQAQHPGLIVHLEPSGSQVAARKVSELGMRADVVAIADATLIDGLLIPSHATWNLEFASNEIVLAHGQHSPFTEEVSTTNWPGILVRPKVRLGRANPDTAPIGYQTLFAWQLAEKSGTYGEAGTGLQDRLLRAVPQQHVAVDETELLSFLETRAIDYAFVYRSTAEDHRLKFIRLPDTQNLSRMDLAATYATAEVAMRMKRSNQGNRVAGHPITYGVTIPTNAPHPTEALAFVAFLLSSEGQRLARTAGIVPLFPAPSRQWDRLPEPLRALAQPVK